MRLAKFVVVLFLWAGLSTTASAETRHTLIEEAISAYRHAQSLGNRSARLAEFQRAAQLFTSASNNGANAELLTNLGTAHLQAAEIGPAVLAFKRALSLEPHNERAARNLLQSRALLPAWVPSPAGDSTLTSFFFFHDRWSTNTRAATAAVLVMVGTLLLALGIRLRHRGAYWLAAATLTAWAAFSISLGVSALQRQSRDAVVVAEETWARAADSANAPTRFPEPLPGGVEVELIETRGKWARVRLHNGGDAWLPRAAVSLLRASEASPG